MFFGITGPTYTNNVLDCVRPSLTQRRNVILRQMSLASFAAVVTRMVLRLLYLKPLCMRKIINWGTSNTCSPPPPLCFVIFWVRDVIPSLLRQNSLSIRGIVSMVIPPLGFFFLLCQQCQLGTVFFVEDGSVGNAPLTLFLKYLGMMRQAICVAFRVAHCAVFVVISTLFGTSSFRAHGSHSTSYKVAGAVGLRCVGTRLARAS